MPKKKSAPANSVLPVADYGGLLADVVSLLESARRTSVRAVNAVMTATYWEIGRRIVEIEQRGDQRADYGDELMKRLASDLTIRFGRGFSVQNIYLMRAFFQAYPQNLQTPSGKSPYPKLQTLSGVLQVHLACRSWSVSVLEVHYHRMSFLATGKFTAVDG